MLDLFYRSLEVMMKFIFPQNYDFSNKLLGIIDYSTLILDIVWGIFTYLISLIFSGNLVLQIAIFIVLFLPFLLLSIIGFNHERMIYIIKYLYIFIKSPKYYLYQKDFHDIITYKNDVGKEV